MSYGIIVQNNPVNFVDPMGLAAAMPFPGAVPIPFIPQLNPFSPESKQRVNDTWAQINSLKNGDLVETTGEKTDTECYKNRDTGDPGDFLHLCFSGCKARYGNNLFKLGLCYAGCIAAAI
jgi:hypothetical protein